MDERTEYCKYCGGLVKFASVQDERGYCLACGKRQESGAKENKGLWDERAMMLKERTWVSVKDRYPQRGEEVIIYVSMHKSVITSYFMDDHWDMGDDHIGWTLDQVTHWMLLPKPPE